MKLSAIWRSTDELASEWGKACCAYSSEEWGGIGWLEKLIFSYLLNLPRCLNDVSIHPETRPKVPVKPTTTNPLSSFSEILCLRAAT